MWFHSAEYGVYRAVRARRSVVRGSNSVSSPHETYSCRTARRTPGEAQYIY
jgi:hypothetical protein